MYSVMMHLSHIIDTASSLKDLFHNIHPKRIIYTPLALLIHFKLPQIRYWFIKSWQAQLNNTQQKNIRN